MIDYLVINCSKDIRDESDLRLRLKEVRPQGHLFFIYWKWKVPSDILRDYTCIGFHTGPLLEGKGRGGSPIQNLKRLGVRITTLCAFQMTDQLDGGRVKLALPISLSGTMPVIWERIESLAPDMIEYLLEKQPDIPNFFKRSDA